MPRAAQPLAVLEAAPAVQLDLGLVRGRPAGGLEERDHVLDRVVEAGLLLLGRAAAEVDEPVRHRRRAARGPGAVEHQHRRRPAAAASIAAAAPAAPNPTTTTSASSAHSPTSAAGTGRARSSSSIRASHQSRRRPGPARRRARRPWWSSTSRPSSRQTRGAQRLAREHDAGEAHAVAGHPRGVAVELGVDDGLGDHAVGAQAVQDRAREAGASRRTRGRSAAGCGRRAAGSRGPAGAAVGVTITASGSRSGGPAGPAGPRSPPKPPSPAREDAGRVRPQRAAVDAGDLGRRLDHRGAALVVDAADRARRRGPCRRAAAGGARRCAACRAAPWPGRSRCRGTRPTAARSGARSAPRRANVGSTCRPVLERRSAARAGRSDRAPAPRARW